MAKRPDQPSPEEPEGLPPRAKAKKLEELPPEAQEWVHELRQRLNADDAVWRRAPAAARQEHGRTQTERHREIQEKHRAEAIADSVEYSRRGLARHNDNEKAQRIADEDARRSEVENRLAQKKSHLQIAKALGWNKTKVTRAIKRWGLK